MPRIPFGSSWPGLWKGLLILSLAAFGILVAMGLDPLMNLALQHFIHEPNLIIITHNVSPEHDIVVCWTNEGEGGAWAKRMTAVEMQFLELDHFNIVDRDEGEWARDSNKMRTLGADWYSQARYEVVRKKARPLTGLLVVEIHKVLRYTGTPDVEIGMEAAFDGNGDRWLLDARNVTSSQRNVLARALTMEERWLQLKKLGAQHCPFPNFGESSEQESECGQKIYEAEFTARKLACEMGLAEPEPEPADWGVDGMNQFGVMA